VIGARHPRRVFRPYPNSAPPDSTWSTPVVNVASAARYKHNRPASSIVPLRPHNCAASPAARVAAGSSDVSIASCQSGV